MKKLILLSVGGAAGYVLGARAGRPAYDRILRTWQEMTRRTGLGDLAATAKEAAVDVRDVAAGRASDVVSKGADDLAQRIDQLVPDRLATRQTETEFPLPTGP